MARYRKKPLAQLEFGTRIYAPTPNDPRFRVVTTDPLTRQRVFANCTSEQQARAKARELELFIAQSAPIREPKESGPRTISRLADRYVDEHLSALSTGFRNKHTYLLRRWILPHLAERTVTAWTPADSVAVLAAARRAGVSDATVQDIGSAMRALVTHARRLRWLTAQSENPMWMVRYAKTATIQGNTSLYVPRSALPTDDDCNQLFAAMEDLGHHRWAIAMCLVHRSGLRWGELTALQPADISFEPRVVHVRRAVEQPTSGPPSIKLPKNNRIRTSIFPKSLTGELQQLVDETIAERGPDAWLFPAVSGQLMRRTSFQQIWIRAADTAGWPMTSPLKRSAGYGEKNKGWRWTGAAKWSPHDLRHVAACWMLFDLKLDPAVVADKLGHADPSFTVKRYVGIRGDADQAAMTATENW